MKLLLCLSGILCINLSFTVASPEAFEVSESLFSELPGGKEADGIVGDFILRNDLVEAVIAQNAPFRKANMGTFWGANGSTQGCLYDLSLRGSDNDQITIFSPLGLRGGVSYVKVLEENDKDEAAIETVITSAKGGGLFTRHLYIIRNGWSGVLIKTTLRNDTQLEREVKLSDSWNRFGAEGKVGNIKWADSIDPSDKCGYAYSAEGDLIPNSIKLKPLQEYSFSRFLAVSTSPLAAVGVILNRAGDTVKLNGAIKELEG